jgi:hypothetical protein
MVGLWSGHNKQFDTLTTTISVIWHREQTYKAAAFDSLHAGCVGIFGGIVAYSHLHD